MTPALATAMLVDMRKEAQRIQQTDIDCRLAEIRRAAWAEERAELWAALLAEYAAREIDLIVRSILEAAASEFRSELPQLRQDRALTEAEEHERLSERRRG